MKGIKCVNCVNAECVSLTAVEQIIFEITKTKALPYWESGKQPVNCGKFYEI